MPRPPVQFGRNDALWKIIMEALKLENLQKKYADETPEEKQQRKRKELLPAFVYLGVSVAMLIIGVKYDTPELCPGSKPLDFWHLVELSCMLVSSALKILAYVTLCEFDDKIAEFLTPLLDAAYFIVIIWGSFLVFGKFWSYLTMLLGFLLI